MNRTLVIRLDAFGVGEIIIVDGANKMDVAKYTTGFSIENTAGEPSIVTLQLAPMDLEIELPAELKVLVDASRDESGNDTA
jgi:hypothetical protein